MNKTNVYVKLNQFLNKCGFDIRRFPTKGQKSLLKYLKTNNITCCFDVGANIGQYAVLLRSMGFEETIYSFEPQRGIFHQLTKRAQHDPKWKVFNIGFGNADANSVINISKNSVSSSVLGINENLVSSAPDTAFINKEDIELNRIDTFLKEKNIQEKIFLKIDAQGFESKIIEGAEKSMTNIFALQLELPCVELYKGEKLFDEMKALIESKGFHLSSLENGLIDFETGRLLEVEAVFLKTI